MHHLSTVLVLMTICVAVAAGEAPLGSKDFYPSPQRPVGFRGDGTGWFPGATPVDAWADGTPHRIEQAFKDGHGRDRTAQVWMLRDRQPRNIVWRTEMPGWVNGQPIVVGDRVFTFGEPDLLICVDANDGSILWTRAINPWLCAGEEPQLAERLRELSLIHTALDAFITVQFAFGTTCDYYPHEQYVPMLEMFIDQDLPVIMQALQQLDPQGCYQEPAQQMVARLRHWQNNPGDDRAKRRFEREVGQLRGAVARRIGQLSSHKIPLGVPWGNMMGWNMSSPISDGQRIYVQMGQGQLAALDLDGNVLWAGLHAMDRGPSTHHAVSPLLVDGHFIHMMDASTLHALDAATGRATWQAPTARPEKSGRSGYYVATHLVVDLDGTRFIVTSQCHIIRARDGRPVGIVDFGENYHGGPPLAGWGDVIIKAANGDGWNAPFQAFRLVKRSDDEVVAEHLWTEPGRSSAGYESRIVTPQATFLCGRDNGILNTLTGERLADSRVIGGLGRVLVGNRLITYPSGSGDQFHSSWGRRRPDGTAMTAFTMIDVSNPAQPRQISEGNIIVVDSNPLYGGVERFLPNLWQHPHFYNKRGGKPAHGIHTDTPLFASGNRLFIRSLTHLIAVGDPRQRYDWNPASRRR